MALFSVSFADNVKCMVSADTTAEAIKATRQKTGNSSELLNVFDLCGEYRFIRDYDGNPALKPYFDRQQEKYGHL
jgi:hypothetical protein